MITTTLQGRLGNEFYQIVMLLAYCKKYNKEYYIPNIAYHCDGRKMYFPHIANGPELTGLKEIHEQQVHAVPKGDGTYNYNVPVYQDLPEMDNVKFVGYWQSFKYFDWCRDYILEKFGLTNDPFSYNSVSLHFRRGDFLQLTDKHPPVPIAYYQKAIDHFYDLGYTSFFVFSDDMKWCKETLPDILSTGGIELVYADGGIELVYADEGINEYRDLIAMSRCKHNILCYSTFGFIAAWLNRNPDKQIIIPPKRFVFSGSNKDFIPDYFTPLEFE